jgi:hypothetical protein
MRKGERNPVPSFLFPIPPSGSRVARYFVGFGLHQARMNFFEDLVRRAGGLTEYL